MTSDLELNRKLALAIGWREDQMEVFDGEMLCIKVGRNHLREFRHDSWLVAGPIAEKFDCFPYRQLGDKWDVQITLQYLGADTPQRAIALAVIQGAGK